MKLLKSIFLLIVVTVMSCTEQEDIQPQNDEETFEDINPVDGDQANFYVKFSTGNEARFETGYDISFENQSVNLNEFQWDFGDGNVSSDFDAQHDYSKPGKYIATLTGTTVQGIAISYSQELFIRKQGSELDLLFISYQDNSLNYVDLSSNTLTKLYDVPYNPAGVLALDESSKKVYYYDYSKNVIIENSLESNNPTPILQDLPGVSDMEFDQESKRLFIALSYDDIIIQYDPTNQSMIESYGSSNVGKFGKVRDMDLKDGSLYTVTPTQSYEAVFEVNIDGGDVSQLIDYQSGGYGYGVAFDDLNDKIYFNNVEEAALMRSDADGSNIEKVIDLDRFGTVSFAGLCLVGLKVVETRNQLLWSSWDDGTLYILDLDSSQEKAINIDGLYGKFVAFESDGLLLN